MPLLVSPDLTLYRFDDESALSALAKAVGPAFPRYENMRQLLGFAPPSRPQAELSLPGPTRAHTSVHLHPPAHD